MNVRVAVATLAVAVALGACGGGGTQAVAATVNGEDIPISEIDRALQRFENSKSFEQFAQQAASEGAAKRQFEQFYLGQTVRLAVLQPAAEELGISVADEEMEPQLEQVKTQFPGLVELFRDPLRAQLLDQKLRERLSEENAPSRGDVRSSYDENVESYRQTRVEHILVRKESLARDIARKLQKARGREVDGLFERLARQHSTDPSKGDGGKLGWLSAASLVQPFSEAMEKLDVGEISDPVNTQFGVHVIRVTGRRLQPFADVSDEIEAQLSSEAGDEAYREWLRNAYEEADVEINPRYGELDPATGLIVNATAEDVPGADDSSDNSG